MKTTFASLCVAGVLAMAGLAGNARAEAPAPVGLWRGDFADGSGTFTLYVKGDGSWAMQTQGAAGIPVGQTGFPWSFNATSVGGILTCHYVNAGRFDNYLYYSITYLDNNRILLSDPYFRVVLRRMP